jgi:hypothetical protein
MKAFKGRAIGRHRGVLMPDRTAALTLASIHASQHCESPRFGLFPPRRADAGRQIEIESNLN